MKVRAEFPDALWFLFKPYRYKVARGGRGSAKSWNFARALLILGMKRKIRVLCAREIQNSIKQSVHKLLNDQISLMGLDDHYRVTETEIKGKNSTEFAFTGLSQLTVDTIKSFEGYDYCWVEEGQVITKRSWDILIPTIRKNGSEIWISYNPELESDETHQRFTVNTPIIDDDLLKSGGYDGWIKNVEMNWRDNPWFPSVLEAERQHCLVHNPDDYDNIWEGKCRPAVEGAIYYKQVQKAEEEKRICKLPYDPMLNVHVVVDLGWEDSMAIGMLQKHQSSLRIIDYIEDHHKTLEEYSNMLRQREYNWGKLYLPHDGYAKNVQTGKSSYDVFKALGWKVVDKLDILNLTIEEGIRITRQTFSQLYFDKDKCSRLIECLKRYRRNINKQTDAPGTPMHDEYSHGADMTRYLCVNHNRMVNEITSQIEYNEIHGESANYDPLTFGMN